MKAYVLHGINDLRFQETQTPVPGPGEALVKVKAVGICGSDIPRIYQTGTYTFPLIPGHEFAGQVVSVGADTDSSWVGRRVGVFPLLPCGGCQPCRQKNYELCRSYSYLGSRTNGGFAEFVAVPKWNLIELPPKVSYEAAAMLEPMAVAVHAMRGMKPGREETVAVCGLGTIGTLLVMFLKEAGIENVLAVGNKDFQKECMQRLGLPGEHYLDSRSQEINSQLLARTQGQGAGASFECVGKNETIEAVIGAAAPGGRVLLVGNPASDISFEKAVYWKILRNQLMIKGSWNSSFTHSMEDDWHYVLERLERGTIDPERYITQKLAFEELGKGLRLMRDKTEAYMKVMVKLD